MPNSLFVSALEPGGLDGLRASLLDGLRRQRPMLEIRLPAGNGRMIAEIHRDGEVVDQRTDEDVIVLQARLDDRTIGRLRQAGARITVLKGVHRAKPTPVPSEVS
jgi:GTP-binding protein HflX